MTRVLGANVVAHDARGRTVLWRRGTTPPPEVAERLGAHVWVDAPAENPPADPSSSASPSVSTSGVLTEAPPPDPEPEPVRPVVAYQGTPAPLQDPAPEPAAEPISQPDGAFTEPPRAGRGASAERWREFAANLGQPFPPEASRDSIIQFLVAAGLIPEH